MKIKRSLAVFLLKIALLAWIANSIYFLTDEMFVLGYPPIFIFNTLIPSLILLGILFGFFEEKGN